jgi:putative acetyltransferase
MENKEIYQADATDFDEIITVWEAAVRSTHDFLTERDIQAYKSLIYNEYLALQDLYVTKENDAITGFIGINDDLVQMLFIDPSCRGTGIGTQLLNYAIDTHGINKVDVNEQNEQALGFYKHFGFMVTERSEGDAAGKPYPVLSMEI